MTFGIYTVTNPAGEKYIGASRNIRERWRQHRKAAKQGRAVNAALQSSFARYGLDAHAFALTASPVDPSKLAELELLVIAQETPALNVQGTDRDPFPPILLTWHGVTKPLNQWCRENGVAEKTREFRKRAGWPPEQIAGLVPRTTLRKLMNKRSLTINGKTMYVTDWAKQAGISYQTLMSRLNLLKWTPEQAVGLVPSPKDEARARAQAAREESKRRREARQVTVDGVTGTLSAVCRELGLPYGRMDYMIRSGQWTAQEAADYLRRV